MYDKILIPTDGSTEADKGAKHGVDLAAAVGAEVHGLYVIEEGGNPWLSEPMDDQMERAKSYGEEITGEIGDLAADAGVDFVSAVEAGPSVAQEIVSYAEEEDIDLIVMGSGYRGTIGGVLGGTAEKVLRSTTVPVTTLRRGDIE